MADATVVSFDDAVRWLVACVQAHEHDVTLQTAFWLFDLGMPAPHVKDALDEALSFVYQEERAAVGLLHRFHDLLDMDDRQEA